MNELLKKYSIKDIVKKTSISPSFVKKLANYEFKNIEKFKFKGFLNILKNEFPDIDFSELEEKAEEFYSIQTNLNETSNSNNIINKVDSEKKEKKSNKFYLILLLILGVGVLFVFVGEKMVKSETKKSSTELIVPKKELIKDDNISNNEVKIENEVDNKKSENIISQSHKNLVIVENKREEKNNSKKENLKILIDKNVTKINKIVKKSEDKNKTTLKDINKKIEDIKISPSEKMKEKENKILQKEKITKIKKIETKSQNIKKSVKKETKVVKKAKKTDYKLTIIPLSKVWFKIYFITQHKTKEYFTNKKVVVIIPQHQKVFIKLGHGMVKFKYNNKIIFPKRHKITRIIINDKNLKVTTKHLKEFE